MLKLITLAFILATSVQVASAQQAASNQPPNEPSKDSARSESGFKFLAGLGISFGGDKLVSIPTTGKEASVSAGSGAFIHVGFEKRFANDFALQTTIGYHSDSDKGSNGSISFTRVPFELIGYKGVTDKVRLGLGLRQSTSAQFSSSGVATSYRSSDSATASVGFLLSVEYLVNEKFGISGRVVNESFQFKNDPKTYDGTHAGVLFNVYL
jgi:hypothetical protein